jgi:type VI protein secretion system component Hcp
MKYTYIILVAILLGGGTSIAYAQTQEAEGTSAEGAIAISVQEELNSSASTSEGGTKAQDYNSSRSNTTAPADALDDDSDGDSLEDLSVSTDGEIDKATPVLYQNRVGAEGSLEAGVQGVESIGKELDKATPLLFRADGSSEVGFQAEFRAGATASSSGTQAQVSAEEGVLKRVSVNAVEVRSWDNETKDAIREHVSEGMVVQSSNDFGLRMAQVALDQDEIRNIESTETETTVEYDTEIKLFGFISMNVRATVRARADGEVDVKYPWYSFLASKGDQAAYMSLAQELRADHDAAMSVTPGI